MEATFDEDTTLLGNESKSESTVKEAKGWQKVAIGGVAGIALGSGSTLLVGMNRTDGNEGPGEESRDISATSEPEKPSWAVGDIDVATSVNDDMKFGEAFATARAEVGPGGAFEWHGNVYATYNADEWNGMSAQDKAQFNNHFSWNHGHAASQHSENSYADNHSSPESELEAVTVETSADNTLTAQTDTYASEPETIDVVSFDSELEVLGFMQDEDTGAFIAGISVNGQEAILVDFDGDLAFDVMATDLNNNGALEDNEVMDIQGAGITLDGIAAHMMGDILSYRDILSTGDILTSSDTIDMTPDNFFDI